MISVDTNVLARLFLKDDLEQTSIAQKFFMARTVGDPAFVSAVVIAELHGAPAGLAALDIIAGDKRLSDYQPYWAARADLLARLSDKAAANDAYQRAIGLESDPAIRNFLEERRRRAIE